MRHLIKNLQFKVFLQEFLMVMHDWKIPLEICKDVKNNLSHCRSFVGFLASISSQIKTLSDQLLKTFKHFLPLKSGPSSKPCQVFHHLPSGVILNIELQTFYEKTETKGFRQAYCYCAMSRNFRKFFESITPCLNLTQELSLPERLQKTYWRGQCQFCRGFCDG